MPSRYSLPPVPPPNVPSWMLGMDPEHAGETVSLQGQRLRGRVIARVGEWLDPETGRYQAQIDDEGYEWVVPAVTSNAPKPFARAVGYNRDQNKLRVVFREGSPVSHGRGTWAYENVTGRQWYELRRRASTGRFVIRNLKDAHINHFEDFEYPW